MPIIPYDQSEINTGVSAASNALVEIPFVEFTTKLVRDTLQSLLDVTLDQMEAYAELVAAVSKSLKAFTDDTFGTSDEYIRTYLVDLLTILPDPPSTGVPITDVKIMTEANYNELIAFFSGITIKFPDPNDNTILIDTAFEGVFTTLPTSTAPVVINSASTPALEKFIEFVQKKMESQAAITQSRLEALLKLGMQKLVIEKGEIYTKLVFHVDSHQSGEKTESGYQNTYSDKITSWGASKPSLLPGPGNKLPISTLGRRTFGRAMVGSISANAGQSKTVTNLNVKVVNEKSTSATNLTIDIIGSVKIEFKTDYFPSFIPEK